ncbi:MAG: Zn-dependent hydrolase, partial [Acidobacteriota bacterium]
MRRASITVPLLVLLTACLSLGCPGESPDVDTGEDAETPTVSPMQQKVDQYTSFTLTTDTSLLTDAHKQMIPLLIEAADAMDRAFWKQAYGDRDALMASLSSDEARRYAEINYGPWDRLDANAPFVDGVGPKPPGANFYPADATREELEAAGGDVLGQYTMVERTESGDLKAIPYSEYFAEEYTLAAEKLRAAAALAEDPGLENYLELRADALLSDDYQPSDLAWMDMKTNGLDVVIGPVENYEDQMFGRKSANEAFVLVKDQAWSARLTKYAAMLPELQIGLPVPDAYKQESPGSESDLGAYDVVYYAGDCNAGSKTIAINLPNDEEVQLQKGTRRLQLKNAMRAKFDEILVPIAGELIAESQRRHVTFDAFFGNT